MHWGYALVWPRAFLTRDADPLMAKLKFLAHYGLETTGIGLREVVAMSEAQRDDVGTFLAQHNLSLIRSPWVTVFRRRPRPRSPSC